MEFPDEYELEDDYPCYAGYVYVVDGEVRECQSYCNVATLKRRLGATSIKRCNIIARMKQLKEQEKV